MTQSWRGNGFRIELQLVDCSADNNGAKRLAYRVFDDIWAERSRQDPLIFAGDDLLSAPGTDIGHQAAQALSAIFGYGSEDVADSYFAPYTPAQQEWRDARAGDLSAWGSGLSAHP